MLTQQNSKKQGDVGLGSAIAYYCTMGYTVCIPLTDSQDYDLIVDDGNRLYKVQVKTTRSKNNAGSYVANLKVSGGNKSSSSVKLFNHNLVDWLFILTDKGTRYNIPTSAFTASTKLTLSDVYQSYII